MKENETISEQLKLYSKINTMRLRLSDEMFKSGANTYAKFTYFQLKDFMPRVISLCNELEVFTKFQMEKRKIQLPNEITKACIPNLESGEVQLQNVTEKENFSYGLFGVLYVTDLDTGYTEEYIKEAKEATVSGASAIQNVGATSTYMKRYMYMDLFEINENDQVDGDNKGVVETTMSSVKSSKPKVSSVKTQKEIISNPLTEVPKVEPTTPVKQSTITNVSQEPVINKDELMKVETKMYIANYAKEKGLDQRNAIISAAKTLNTDVPLFKESQKDQIIALIDAMASNN